MRLGRFGAVLVAACAGSSGDRKPTTPGDQVMCVDEAMIGSHIVETRCYTPEEIQARNDRNRAALERVQLRSRKPGRYRRGGP